MAGSGRHSFKALLHCDKGQSIRVRTLVTHNNGRSVLKQVMQSSRSQMTKNVSSLSLPSAEIFYSMCTTRILSDSRFNCRSVSRSVNSVSCPVLSYSPMFRHLYLHQYLLVRNIHFSRPLRDGEPPSKASSKVEETAKALTEANKGKQEGTVAPSPKRPLYKRIQDEILHYYHGFRLLFIDMKITGHLLWRILNGKSLSRREHKQLIRTTSDVFRLVPFSVFIIVPFMELLLPVFLKLFPGMLPSTFQTLSDRETKMKAELKVKIDMAKFLQETLDEMAPQAKGRSSQTAKEFAEFIHKIRDSGSEVSNVDIMKFSKLFEDEITLDSLSRPQLTALCRVLEIPALGTTAMLRFQLRMRLRSLAADDQMIEKEGVDALNYNELQVACKARGMRAVGVTEERLRRQINQWLQLSLHEKVPPSLLLLSRAMYLPDTLPASAQLQATLSALPDGTALQTKAAIGEREGKIDNKTRIELLREEERLIREERQEAKRKEKEEKAAPLPPSLQHILAHPDRVDEPEPSSGYVAPPPVSSVPPEVIPGIAPISTELGPTGLGRGADNDSVIGIVNRVLNREIVLPKVEMPEDKLTAKDFEAIEEAIDKISKARKEMILEKEELQDLKEEMDDYKEDLKLLEAVIKQSGSKKVKVNKGAKRLFNKLNTMISELETRVDHGDKKETPLLPQENVVTTEELIEVMRKIKTVEEDPLKVERITRVLAKLDDDRDGKIEVDDLIKVIEIVGRENVNLTSKQLEEIVSILAKEETLEEHKKSGNP